MRTTLVGILALLAANYSLAAEPGTRSTALDRGVGDLDSAVVSRVVTDCANNALAYSADLREAVEKSGYIAQFTLTVVGITCVAELLRRNGAAPGPPDTVPKVPNPGK